MMTVTSTAQWEASCLVNDAFGTTSWLFQDVTSHSLFFTGLYVSATFCVSFHAGSSFITHKSVSALLPFPVLKLLLMQGKPF
jgi:hypothetical protein